MRTGAKTLDQNRAQRHARHTRKKLLQASLSMFAEKGIDATTIENITETADLGKGTFYRHFSDKEEVVVALIEETVDDLVAEMHAQESAFVALTQVLEHILSAHVAFFLHQREKFILLFQGRLLLKLERKEMSALEEPIMRYLEEIEKQIAPFVEKAIDPSKVRRLVYAVAGFVSGFLSFAMIGMAAREIEKSLEPLRHAFVSGSLAFLVEQNALHASDTFDSPISHSRRSPKDHGKVTHHKGR